jgi:hypothetical protein
MWSEKLSQIAEMTPAFMGLTDLTLEEARQTGRPGEENGGTLTLQSICAGRDHSRIANVRRIFEGEYRVAESSDPWVGKRFRESFQDLLPTGTQMVEVKDCVETEALKFSLEMPVKPASKRLEEALGAARADLNVKAAEEGNPAATKTAAPKGAPGARTENPVKPEAKDTKAQGPAPAAAPVATGAGSAATTEKAGQATTPSGKAAATKVEATGRNAGASIDENKDKPSE